MEAIVLEAIGAVAIIVAALIGVIASARKLGSDLAVHSKGAEDGKALLSHEHTGLKEQVAQVGSAMKEQVAQVGSVMKEQVAQVSSTVIFLKEEKLKEAARQEALQGRELQVDEIATLLHAVSREGQELRQQVSQLTAERDALAKENADLTAWRSRQQERDAHAREDEDQWEP